MAAAADELGAVDVVVRVVEGTEAAEVEVTVPVTIAVGVGDGDESVTMTVGTEAVDAIPSVAAEMLLLALPTAFETVSDALCTASEA